MHPLVDIAQQDLSFDEPLAPHARGARSKLSRLAARVLRAWMTGWTWYARQGLAPAAVEPVYPFRARPGVRRVPPRVARRITLPAPIPVAQLYDCATPAGCP